MILFQLFCEFFAIGLFTLGGGMATLPLLQDLSVKTGWFTESQIADMIAVSESTPGPIGINMATYTGYTVAGIPGAIAATLGEIVPGIILVMIIARILGKFRNNFYVESAFYGIRPCSAALIAASGIMIIGMSLLQTAAYEASGQLLDLFDWKAILLAAGIWFCTNVVKQTKKLHPIVFIGFSAIIGIVFSFG